MWQCRPTRCTDGDRRARSTARGGVAVGQVEAELGVVLARRDVLVGVGVHARRDAQQHVRRRSPTAGVERVEAVELVEAVDDHVTDAGRRSPSAARRGSCCCRASMHADAGTPAASATCSSPPLATSRSMPSSWARRAIARHRNAFVAYIDPPGAERLHRLPTAGPQVRLVVDEDRRAERRRRARRRDSRRSPGCRRRATVAVSGRRWCGASALTAAPIVTSGRRSRNLFGICRARR